MDLCPNSSSMGASLPPNALQSSPSSVGCDDLRSESTYTVTYTFATGTTSNGVVPPPETSRVTVTIGISRSSKSTSTPSENSASDSLRISFSATSEVLPVPSNLDVLPGADPNTGASDGTQAKTSANNNAAEQSLPTTTTTTTSLTPPTVSRLHPSSFICIAANGNGSPCLQPLLLHPQQREPTTLRPLPHPQFSHHPTQAHHQQSTSPTPHPPHHNKPTVQSPGSPPASASPP